jgi:hypothetical protein
MNFEQNQDSAAEAVLAETEIPGWDPFQVWKTRVREPQLRAHDFRQAREADDESPLRKTA